ncbi:hypothetical protein AAL_06070 [Moelleriella libera RCEF 2490]|uniref:Uncharacterized protein n=1 Tax=Moelleriella libera RCEF 2490 TaxID=1081109 RepID=A0A167ZBN6_9HYPO|nr:hypothetical protein AAL_06070 [Moelleriella libera RCEF 2490]
MTNQMLNTLAVLMLVGHARAQMQTKATDPINNVRIPTITLPDPASISAATANPAHHHHHNHTVTSEPKTTTFTAPPWSSGPERNAARRPSQPGMKKLTLFVSLATYGLILL